MAKKGKVKRHRDSCQPPHVKETAATQLQAVHRKEDTSPRPPQDHPPSSSAVGNVGQFNENAPMGSYALMLSTQLVELLGKDQETWPCWKECLTGVGLEVSKVQTIPSWCSPPRDSRSKWKPVTPPPQHHANPPATVLPSMRAMDSPSLSNCKPQLNFSSNSCLGHSVFVTAIEN